MAARVCMNPSCGVRAVTEWKKGWELRSGGFACLCDKCGSAFEQLVFCDTFHLNESGWRECSSCGKRLHCGCIASKISIELLDSGGVECVSCSRNSEHSSVLPGYAYQDSALDSSSKVQKLPHKSPKDDKPSGVTTSGNLCEQQSSSADTKIDDNTAVEVNNSHGTIKREHIALSQAVRRDDAKESETLADPSLNITLGASNPNLPLPIPSLVVEGREISKLMSPFQQGLRSRHLLPKPPKGGPNAGLDTSKDVVSQIRVARPPGEGRGRNQLLPRYWPRITDQELQQISGDSNSTIVPLFEKVLSASDAGRIGRLVLPKACAEAYFPPISQPEGLPLKIQDAKGKDWVFQFRFWPNNNSRMYVLEGVTPCIQSMQLQAGDTVTFSRLEPEGKLVMGFRKASNSIAMQDTQVSAAVSNGAQSKESFISGVIENLPIISGYSGLLQSLKGSADPHLNALSEHLNSAEGDISWLKPEKHVGRPVEGFPQPSMPIIDRRRSRNIGSKSKRLVIDTEDALELKITWEEAQELLRPPPSMKPSVVVIDDHEFEEYEEPPVFGKRTIFTARASGGQDQWVQCDSCYKWRRLPMDVLIQSNWICAENMWDSKRNTCSAPVEISPKELENLLRMNMGTQKSAQDRGLHSGLDALASAAVLGDDGNSTPPLAGPTTKHPRHRPGCMCIVCIQPPSGKGPKHKPTCTCNVCMTVKRRFKTLMMRKKKRQMEREAETANKRQVWVKEEGGEESSSRRDDSESVQTGILLERAELGKVGIDLNSQPDREEDANSGSGRVSMVSLLQVATRPLETYLKQNGLTSLISETPVSSSSLVLPPVTVESEGLDDGCFPSAVKEREGVGDTVTEQTRSDPV
ncbi:B3 domain-containing protein Os07g0679700-like isoform X2 [Aristolochia californica]|uniref:B3 domain-containing protein Os07g0679700-like isoform X2 n=1 Tax=Aristolochia californica TaxID=171875 RepID=UPI0035D5F6F4